MESFVVSSPSSAAILMLSEVSDAVGIASRVNTKRKACLNLVRTRFLSVARFEIPLIVVTNPNGVYPCLTWVDAPNASGMHGGMKALDKARNSKNEFLTDVPLDVVNRAFPAVCHCTLHSYDAMPCKHL